MNNKNKRILNNIICPKCKESLNLVLLNIDNDKIILDKCKNKHKTIFYSFKDFIESQNITTIKCKKCKNSSDNYNNILYYNKNEEYICSLCKNNGDNLIKINDKYYKCNKHNDVFISYCNDCNINLCYKCEINHSKHKIIYLKQIIIKKNKIEEIKKNIIEFKELINKYKEEIKKMNVLYMDLSEYISYSLDNLNNYESIINVTNINIKNIIKDINLFLTENNIDEKMKYLL